jgi:hypothetical protein
MLIEELSVLDGENKILGRCIHLDSDASFGTSFEKAILNHLDLAVGVYYDDAAKTRQSETLKYGKIIDATHRTHLFRIENIPFPAMLAYVRMFFRSLTLTNEFLMDQFGPDEKLR